MRLIAFALAAFIFSGPATAQNWQEYSYPAYSFTVAFPADPQSETTTYRLADGRAVEAHVYSVRQNNSVLKVTVAELANTNLAESAVIDHAIKTLSEGGEVKINIPHRVYRIYGRQLSIMGTDGSRSTVAMFDHNGRLYLVEGKAFPGGDPIDIIRFQQSLVFTDGGSNRSPEAIRAINDACRAAGVANPAGPDDPHCARQ
ncbi:MAG TPA: hypothetical protein VKP67_13500 [Xanthobacteraceae bacterium]|nr:hypothetical protein [Xanthobacteraceae bacterium]